MADAWVEQTLLGALGLRTGESVVLMADERLEAAGRALEAGARAAGADSVSLHLLPHPARRLTVVPTPLVREVARADVVLSLLSQFDLAREMPVLQAAMAAFRQAGRGRWGYGAAVDVPLLEQAMAGDCREVARAATSLAASLKGVKRVRITTALGTDLTLELGDRPVHVETSLLRGPGSLCNLPGGEAYAAPLESSAEGRLVVDLSLGDLPLDQPVAMEFRGGRAVALKGGKAARALRERLGSDRWAWTVGEFGLGANPFVPVRGRATTDEKVLGTAHVALGGNLQFGGANPAVTHYDCVICEPRITLHKERGEASQLIFGLEKE